jgi:5-methyltetrahydrofolate--homocysteine methyltransferase
LLLSFNYMDAPKMKMELQNRILVMDGAMGTLISSTQKDSLNLTAPEVIQSIHRQYLEAGADILKTNTFNSNRGPEDYATNVAGARLARAVANEFTQPRYVAGAMGPGRDGNASMDAYFEQARGLVDGGVDMLLAETITSIRTAQSAISGTEKLFERIGRELPILVSVTISRGGGLISGESLDEFWNAVSNKRLYAVGINCGLGVKQSRKALERLSQMASTKISFHPSAGLPNAIGGYDETPEDFAAIMGDLAIQGHIDIAGGCCGTTPAHIQAIPRVTIDHL